MLPSDLQRTQQKEKKFTSLHRRKKATKIRGREFTCTEHLQYASPWIVQWFHLILEHLDSQGD
jgi:hypothetical protein